MMSSYFSNQLNNTSVNPLVSPDKATEITKESKSQGGDTSLLIHSHTKSSHPDVLSALSKLTYALPSLMGNRGAGRSPGNIRHANKNDKGKEGKKSQKKDGSSRAKITTPGVDGHNWNLVSMAFPSTPPRQDNRVYSTSQMFKLSLTALSSTVPTFNAISFALSSINQYATFQNLFDQYKIDLVEIWIFAVGQQGTVGNGQQIASVIDYDDTSALASFASALDYQNVLVTNQNDGHYRRFQPHVAVATYSGAFTSFKNEVASWIDVASPNVEHYGIKTAAEVATSNNGLSADVRLHVSFKCVR